MARKHLTFTFVIALFVLVVSIRSAFGGNQVPVSPEIHQRLAKTYPNLKIVNGCSGKFAG